MMHDINFGGAERRRKDSHDWMKDVDEFHYPGHAPRKIVTWVCKTCELLSFVSPRFIRTEDIKPCMTPKPTPKPSDSSK